MTTRRHPNVIHTDEAPVREDGRGGFGFRARRLGAEAGGRSLGCSYLEVPVGKTAFPYHFHSNFEEGVYILEGSGTLRMGTETVELRAGDYVAFPAGPAAAHQVVNTGPVPLKYLAMSAPATAATMDVVVYPDSNKVSYASGVDPVKGFRGGVWIFGIHKQQPPADYYLDEPLAGGGEPPK
jgi:uncharacterized cupin superfamily protein|nr:cupin domain-containing protein [Kofleriaceae bacterium]